MSFFFDTQNADPLTPPPAPPAPPAPPSGDGGYAGGFFFDTSNVEPPIATEASKGRRTGFLENVGASFDTAVSSETTTSQAVNEARARDERIAAIEKVSGKSFSATIQPFRAAPGQRPSDDQTKIDDLAVDRWLETIPERQRAGILPSAMLKQRAKEIALDRLAQDASIAARARGGWEAFGGFAGSTAGLMTDPLNIAGLALGAPLSAGVVRTALTEAGVAALTQTGVELVNEPYRRELGLPSGLDRALGNIALTAAGAGILSSAFKGAPVAGRALVDRLAGREGRPLASEVGAAFDQVQAFDDLMHANPFGDSPQARAEHRDRARQVDEAVMNGSPLPNFGSVEDFNRALRSSSAIPSRALGGEADIRFPDPVVAEIPPVERSTIGAVSGTGELRRFGTEAEASAAADRAKRRSGADLTVSASDDGSFVLTRETKAEPVRRPDGAPVAFDKERAAIRYAETSPALEGRKVDVVPVGKAGGRRYVLVENADAADLAAMRAAPDLVTFARGEDRSVAGDLARRRADERAQNLSAFADAIRYLHDVNDTPSGTRVLHEADVARALDDAAAQMRAGVRAEDVQATFSRQLSRDTGPFDLAQTAEGNVHPSADISRYVRDVVRPAEGAAQSPRILFDMGHLSTDAAGAAIRAKPDWHDVPAAVRISNQVIDKLFRKNAGDADALLAELPHLMSNPAEVLPDHNHADRVLFTRPIPGSNAVAVVEAARTRQGLEIVSIHKSPDRTLAKARALANEMGSDGAGGATVPSYGGRSGSAPAAAASPEGEFPTIGTVTDGKIGPATGEINPATVALAREGLLAQAAESAKRFDKPGGPGTVSQARQLATDLSRDIDKSGDFQVGLEPDEAGGIRTQSAKSLLDEHISDMEFLDALKACLK